MGRASKPGVLLAGRPLIAYPVAALAPVCSRLVVVCKAGTSLPELPGVERWDEPDEPLHPVAGILHALERADGPVLVCAADMPFVTADACRTLMQAPTSSSAVVAVSEGILQPVFGMYAPAALDALRSAPSGAPLTETVEALDPVRVAFSPALVRSVNTTDDLAEAEALLAAR